MLKVLLEAGATVNMQDKVLFYLDASSVVLSLRVDAILQHAPSVRTHQFY